MPEEMNRLLRDYFDRKISRRDFIRKANVYRRRFRCCRNFTGTIRSRSTLRRRGGSEGPCNSGGKL